MSRWATAFCVDAPAEADVQGVLNWLLDDGDIDPDDTKAFLTSAPDGLARLVAYVDNDFLGTLLRHRTRYIKSGRLAVAANLGGHMEWNAFKIDTGMCVPVHEHAVLPVDPTDAESMRAYHRETYPTLRVEPGEEEWYLKRPELDPRALTTLARLYNVDSAMLGEAVTAADSAYRFLDSIGDSRLHPFWFACGIPWPAPGSGKPFRGSGRIRTPDPLQGPPTIRQVADLHGESPADVAQRLHGLQDAPQDQLPILILAYPAEATLRARRDAFAPVYRSIVERIGEPTLYGGSARGPYIRWRNSRRTVLLAGDKLGVELSVHDTFVLETGEFRRFKIGGAPWGDDVEDFDSMPYLWELHRDGPGEAPDYLPGGRLSMNLRQLQNSIEVLLSAWIEQLPVQVGEDRAAFWITNDTDERRRLIVDFRSEKGLRIGAEDWDGDDPQSTELALERGWQRRSNQWWDASYPDPDRAEAADAARLLVAELRAHNFTDPDELRLDKVNCAYDGFFRLPGIGVEH